jgi:hypothetical protein
MLATENMRRSGFWRAFMTQYLLGEHNDTAVENFNDESCAELSRCLLDTDK